uniref:Ubiquitin thioesterase OTU1 n=1 Tax=Mesocestoides corti TaxID=53468 RepID=A0A5K3FRY9_MESCO
ERHGINCGQVVQHVCALIRCHTKSGNLGILEPRMTSPVAGSTQNVVDQILQVFPDSYRNFPLVARKAACHWPALQKWTPDYLAEKVRGKLKFRMGRKTLGSTPPQWECDAEYVLASIADLFTWCRGSNSLPFAKYPFGDWWAYASYLHMSATPALSEIQEDVPWESLFPCLSNSSQSTFWLGTDQSHTPCHYDTYGINFVLQVRGKKRWTLFPPSDTPFLYPTRLPLEESTVFSRINFVCPNFIQYPLLLNTHPRVIVLEPGDVLFVPRHWWHFVETIDGDTSCAINVWLDQPMIDNKVRCKEALTQIACFSLAKCAPSTSNILSRLHSTERAFAGSQNWFTCLVDCINTSRSTTHPHSYPLPVTLEPSHNWEIVSETDIVEILPGSDKLVLPPKDSMVSVENIVAAFLHPDVIDLVYSKLCE